MPTTSFLTSFRAPRAATLAVLCAVGAAACSTRAPAACSTRPAIHVDAAGVRRSVVLEMERERGEHAPWILDLVHPADERAILVATSYGALWVDASGAVLRRAHFEGGADHFPVMAVDLTGTGDYSFVGVEVNRKRISVFDSSGERVASRPVHAAPWAWIRVGDVDGDEQSEILLPVWPGKAIQMFSSTLEEKGRISSGRYIDAYRLVNAPSGGKSSVVLYGLEQRRRAVFTVRGPHEVREWSSDQSCGRLNCDFIIVDPVGPEQAHIVRIVDDRLISQSLSGAVLGELRAPGANCFRFLFTAPLPGGARVFVLDGGGYVPGHAVYVYDGQDRLVYHETAPGHARGVLVPVAGENAFWVAVQNTIWRYEM